ncbi:MAG: tripartite tricarboxylate transporter substrate-binding protein [Pseudomonadota bacterium]
MTGSRRAFLGVMAAAFLAAVPQVSAAESDLTIIVPLGEGGALDRMARTAAGHLPAVGGYDVQVENRLIKGTSDGYRDFLQRPADGSTVLAWFEPAAAKYGDAFDLDDLAIINVQEIEPPIFAARSDLGWRTLEDFVAAARKKPGHYKIGAGKAGGNLLIMRRQFEALGISVREVDYASGGKARAGLLRGEIDLTVGALKAIRKLGDEASPLAIMAPRRLRAWPEIPTIVEAVRFADAEPIIGPSYRFFAVRREVKDNHPATFERLVDTFRQLTVEHAPYRDGAGRSTQWFGPAESESLIARAHAHFLDLRQGASILPASHPKR